MNCERALHFLGKPDLRDEDGALHGERRSGNPAIQSALTDAGRRVFFQQRAQIFQVFRAGRVRVPWVEAEARDDEIRLGGGQIFHLQPVTFVCGIHHAA